MTWFVLIFLAVLAVILVSVLAGAMSKTADDGPMAAVTGCFIAVILAIVAVLVTGGAV